MVKPWQPRVGFPSKENPRDKIFRWAVFNNQSTPVLARAALGERGAANPAGFTKIVEFANAAAHHITTRSYQDDYARNCHFEAPDTCSWASPRGLVSDG